MLCIHCLEHFLFAARLFTKSVVAQGMISKSTCLKLPSVLARLFTDVLPECPLPWSTSHQILLSSVMSNVATDCPNI